MKAGQRHTEVSREKMSRSRAGRKLAAEHKAELSASARRFWARIKKLEAAAEAREQA